MIFVSVVALHGRLARLAFPFVLVHDLLIHGPILLVILREPGVCVWRRVFVGIDPGVVGGVVLHLVEAVLGGIKLGHVAKMPFAGEVGLIAVLPVELGDGRRLRPKAVRVAGNDHDRQCCADRDAPGHERGAARRATGLAVPAREHCAFPGHAIDVRRGMPERRASEVHTVVAPAHVVAHEHDDVGLFVLCHNRSRADADQETRRGERSQR